eukprot:CAMPEP_0115838836 /NCGR_PEP_ID=MMETSP0287-20121206/5939_1 /TAXON_ID=412157 /ORGANISM="Chrysochromulina rotalis, Strain UIO044" /LENGTH=42 /DNA_ID= /DNA_START= /DNA_END= /DNA_ORIENTATION=
MREMTSSMGSSGVSFPQQPPILQASSSSVVEASPATSAMPNL